MSQHFLIVYRPLRENFTKTGSPEEFAEVGKHAEYLERLNTEKTVLFAGRVEDASFGYALLETENEEKAREILENDPAVKAKVFTAELWPFRLTLR